MITPRHVSQQARKLTEQLVRLHEGQVKKFQCFSDPELGVEKFNAMALFEDASGKIKDPVAATSVAMAMNNFVVRTKQTIDETSRASIPVWTKTALAMIASAASDDLLDKVISKQMMPQRTGRIHYMDIVTERAKGNIPDRAKMFDALNGFRGTEDYSSQNIENEVIGSAGATDYTPTLGYGPIIPRTLVITDGSQIIRDDGNGNLIGDVGATGSGITNTVDYLARTVSVRFGSATGAAVKASYQYNIEAALMLPEYGVSIRAEQITAQPRALATQWSQQVLNDIMADLGIDLEPTLIEAGARLIQMEKFKHVVNTLRNNATGGTVIFDNTAPTGVSYRDHIKTFALYLSRGQDLAWESTQVIRPNVFVFHPSILFLVAFQDGFEGQTFANDGMSGPRFVGRLTKHGIDCIADPTFPRDQGVMTYRGPEFVSTSAVMASYVELWRSSVHARNFRKDMALLSEYALKTLFPQSIVNVSVSNL